MTENSDINIVRAKTEDIESIVKLHIQSWRESYKGIIAQEFLDNISHDKGVIMRSKIISNEDPRCISLIAESKNNIIGFCDAGPTRDLSLDSKGEIYAIYVLDEYKKSGVGYKLFQEAQKHLTKHSLLPYVAWVLADNKPACDFYERRGGEVVKKKKEPIGKISYDQVAYMFL